MVIVGTQLHGYRQGHQLLAASDALPKADQAVVDQLSDVAGPLRPGEAFAPYLSVYPLPSGRSHVLARTWQDLAAPRAGCVLTFSLIVPAEAWSSTAAVGAFLDVLDLASPPATADAVAVDDSGPVALPPVHDFAGAEFLEALFLEDSGPIVVFDAPRPELVTARLLAAAWPALRGRLTVSTFALSPRRVTGRSFDLTFAPRDARHKFTDWKGRRIDAEANASPRHRWTETLVRRVLIAPSPRLLDDSILRLLGTEAGPTMAPLRLALTWQDLLGKLPEHPSAALGILDLAGTKLRGDPGEVAALAPALTQAARTAATDLPEVGAWDFFAALTAKLRDFSLPEVERAVDRSVGDLAIRSPAAAVAFLDGIEGATSAATLSPAIAAGLARDFDASTPALVAARPGTLIGLVGSDAGLARSVANEPALVPSLVVALGELDPGGSTRIRAMMLRHLVEEFQVPVARPLVESLDAEGLLAEASHLLATNDLAATSLVPTLARRVRELGAITRLRADLVGRPRTGGRDQLLLATLEADVDDVVWLLDTSGLDATTRRMLVRELLIDADEGEFGRMLASHGMARRLLAMLPDDETDILSRLLASEALEVSDLVEVTMRMLRLVPDRQAEVMARAALERCLPSRFDGDEHAALARLLGVVGSGLDGAWAAWRGLDSRLPSDVVDRNVSALDAAPDAARSRVLDEIGEVARAVGGAGEIRLGEQGARACARLLTDARPVRPEAALHAAAILLHAAMRSRHAPVSSLVAVCFPEVYGELMRRDDVIDLFWFVPFRDWDRCRTARRELVDAFLASPTWDPRDLALAACGTPDLVRVLRRVSKADGGQAYIERLRTRANGLPRPCRDEVEAAIAGLGG